MARKRHTAEEIVAKLRQVVVLIAQGRQVALLERISPSCPALSSIELVSSSCSLKTGIFYQTTGEYCSISVALAQKPSLQRTAPRKKPAIAGLFRH